MKKLEYPPVGVADVLKVMWQEVRPQWYVFFLAIIGSLLGNITAAVFIPIYYKRFFDAIAAAPTPKAALPVLVGIVLWILFFNIVQWAMRRTRDFSINNLETNTMARLRQRSLEYLLGHSYGFFTNSFTGSLVQRVSRLARSLESLVDSLVFNMIPLLSIVVGAVAVTWYTERTLSYIIIAWLFALFSANVVFAMWRVKYSILVSEADSRTTGTLADIIGNHSSVALFDAFSEEAKRFREVTSAQAKLTRFTWDAAVTFDAFQGALIFIAEFFVFYFGAKLWSEGAITVGTLVLVQVYLIQLSSQLWDFGRIMRVLYEGYADSKEMVEIMALQHEIQDRPGAKKLEVTEGEIRFDELEFSFTPENQVLKDINLTVRPAEKVALVGPSGAGKTTIVRLLLRLHDISKGAITIDGQDIRECTQASLRRAIGLVPQDPVLFHRSLMENIRYGNPAASDEEVKRAASLAHCDEFIDILPDGYSTFVGERGVKLSGGERQRIAIARAILKNAPILILDEATSSLDSHSEALIQDALDSLMKGKTAIVVAHRLSTIRKMDRIIVLEDGKIREDGTHDKLLKNRNSLYRQLWSLQAGGFIAQES